MPGIAADLPLTTCLMMRSIAEIARSHGEDLASADTRQACIEVFAFGGPEIADEDIDIAYWTIRGGLSHASLSLLIRQVAARFGVMLSQKYLAQAVPLIGAAAGSTLNYVFMDYYQQMARVHFTLRELERRHDPDAVRACFDSLVRKARDAAHRTAPIAEALAGACRIAGPCGARDRGARMDWPTQQGTFDAGDLTLQSGAVLRGARLSWKAHGTLSPARDNVIVYPTSYGAQHPDLEWLIGPDGVLDPTRWFIVIADMFANGLSSSPSNTADYPSLVTIYDNVQVQRRALREHVRHRARRLRLWLVDGCAAGVPLGGAVSRCGRPHRGELRRRAHRRAQPGVPARADGDA